MKAQRWTENNIPDQAGKFAIVTGANTGIGYEAARMLADKGATVVLACRNAERGKAAERRLRAARPSSAVHFEALDLSSLASVVDFSERIKRDYPAIDYLINNAGVMVPPFSQTAEGFELQFGTNHLGHFSLTVQLLPHMAAKRGSRIVVVSSSAAWMGTINYDDPNFTARPYKPWPAYVQSKVANLVFAETLNEMLGTSGSPIACVSVHPGVTTTELQRHWPSVRLLAVLTAMKPALGALPTAFAATAPSAEGGRFYGPDGLFGMRGYPAGAKKISRANQDAFTPENKQRLWEMSESMTGINYARTMGLRRGA